jgi:hypothetical protein
VKIGNNGKFRFKCANSSNLSFKSSYKQFFIFLQQKIAVIILGIVLLFAVAIDSYISNNQLTNLDLSFNTKLTTLDCSGNQLTVLDVSNPGPDTCDPRITTTKG